MTTAMVKPAPGGDAPAARGPQPADRFSFGRNWRRFVEKHLTEERIAEAGNSLAAFLGREAVAGSHFLDIGCGSGLFSLAACRLGARRVVSLDCDEECLECCQELRRRAGRPESWEVRCGSILDAEFVASVEPAEVVYAWGVLHHTGRMWEALERTAGLVRPGGLLGLGLYNHLEGSRGSDYWRKVKERYNHAGRGRRTFMELAFILRHTLLPNLRRGINPLTVMRNYHGRGMSYCTDVVDWLGGLPYEAAAPEDVLHFCRGRFGLVLEKLKTTNGWGMNEFLFSVPSTAARPG